MLPLPELHRDRQPGLRTGNGYLPYGLSSRKWVWYGKGRVCRTNLSTQPRVQQPLPQSRTRQSLPQPGPQGQSHFLSPESSSHFLSHGPGSHFRNPEPSSHFLSLGPSSHFRSQGPMAKATQYRKRGRFCTAGFCKRATGPYLCRSRRP